MKLYLITLMIPVYFTEPIVFIAECKTIDQLTSALETLPGAGVSKIEVFPVPE